MSGTPYYYKGTGPVLAKTYGADAGLQHIGSSSELKITLDDEVEVLEDGDNPAGGQLAVDSHIKSATVNLTIDDCRPANLAIAMQGVATMVDAGTVTDEEVKAYVGALSRLAHIPTGAVVVKNQAGDVTYVDGSDYTVSGAGINIPAGSTITDKSTIKVSYAYGEEATIEAMLANGALLTICFDGINSTMDGKPRVVDLHKVYFGPAKEISYKDKGFAKVVLQGRMLRDESITGGESSKYWRERIKL